jgi:antitoxin VapB
VAVQIANPAVAKKIARLAQVTGLTKTAAVALAVDSLLHQTENARAGSALGMSALLAQLDQVPDRPDAFDALSPGMTAGCPNDRGRQLGAGCHRFRRART